MSTSTGQSYNGMPQYNSGGTTQNPYSNAWGGPDLRVGSTDVNQNMQRTAQNLPNAPYWLQTQHAGYYGAPMSSNPMEYGRWNWAGAKPGMVDQSGGAGTGQSGGAGTGQTVNQQPISTTQQPMVQPQSAGGFGPQQSPNVPWNGVPNAPGDPWVSGSGNGNNTYQSAPGTGQPIIGNPAGLLGSAGDSQRIGGADWWAAIQAMQNRG